VPEHPTNQVSSEIKKASQKKLIEIWSGPESKTAPKAPHTLNFFNSNSKSTDKSTDN
jgi:hypothetical protein